jgi:RimJ/RimL family protein N-acetyltransferase
MTGQTTSALAFPDDVPVLTDGEVTLRAHTATDASGVWEQCIDPVSQRWTTVPVPYSRADAEEFVGSIVPRGWRTGAWAFAVEARDEDGTPRFAGTVELRARTERRAEIAYGAHPWARGRGIMHRALELLLAWGFEERRLRTVIWWAHRGNWASRRTAWRLGFSCDGTVDRWLPQRGHLLDAWVGALHADDDRSPRTTWLEVPEIGGQGVVLRPFRDDDAPRIVEACSDGRTSWWLGNMPSPYTLADAEEYLRGRQERLATGAGVSWAVADPGTDAYLGSLSLFDLKPGREAEVGYLTHPAARGRGVMTEATGLAVRHGFTPVDAGGLGLRRLLVYAAEGNTASRRVIERNGFVLVGRERRGTELRDGSLVDTACYDLLAEEYAGTASPR